MECTCAPFENAAGRLCPFCVDRETRLLFGSAQDDHDALFGNPSEIDADAQIVASNLLIDIYIQRAASTYVTRNS